MRLAVVSTTTFFGAIVLARPGIQAAQVTYLTTDDTTQKAGCAPPPSQPEPIEVTELPLPPVVAINDESSCTAQVNPRRTGCIGVDTSLAAGEFLPDGDHVVASVRFEGAPPAPDSASIYTGNQIILIKTDGTTFPSGDPWKCVTCGVPDENARSRTDTHDYPQAFIDGNRMLAGTNIIDCSPFQLTSPECTPDKVHISSIRWNVAANGTGEGGSIRELRLHPDNVHLGFNAFTVTGGKVDQYGYLARLQFNPSPELGLPKAPRYDLVNVTRLYSAENKSPIEIDPNHPDMLRLNPDAIWVGELRGFSGTGREVTYIGYPVESSNIDLFAADLITGEVRRLTADPGYTDPIDVSPDDRWSVVLDTRATDRQTWVSGFRGIPPLTDMVSTSAVSSVRNNGNRRFFQPFLIDRYGDRSSYAGQQINAEGDGSPNSVNDPQWNAMADPRWSLDGTRIAYGQALTVAPACGGQNPLPCPPLPPSGRIHRLMMARLTSRKPIQPLLPVAAIPDTVPWGTSYEPGSTTPAKQYPPGGNYTLKGKLSGSAQVLLTKNQASGLLETVAVTYHNFSNTYSLILNGNEKMSVTYPNITLNKVEWHSSLYGTGKVNYSKLTSPGGFHLDIDTMQNIFKANGTLNTTINGRVFTQPANGT